MPPALRNKPELFDDVITYFSAFMMLSRSRNDWNKCISLTDMKSYCELFEVDDFDFFIKAVIAMDNKYLEKALEKHGRNS